MSKPLSHARLVIDALQFVDHLIIPSIRSSKFGCDSLRMLEIEPRGPTPKPIRLRDWDPQPWVDMLYIVWGCPIPLLQLVVLFGITRVNAWPWWPVPWGERQDVMDLLAARWGVTLASSLETHNLDIWTSSLKLVVTIDFPSPFWNHCNSWKMVQDFIRHHDLSIHHSIPRASATMATIAEWGGFFVGNELLPYHR